MSLPEHPAPEAGICVGLSQRIDVDLGRRVGEFEAPEQVDVLPGHR